MSRKDVAPRAGERNRGHVRCGCHARLSVVKQQTGDGWVVSTFVEEHNHRFTTPSRIHLLRSHQGVSKTKKALVQQFSEANIPTCQQVRPLEIDAGVPSSLGCVKKDIRNYQRDVCNEMLGHDAKTLIEHFTFEKEKNPIFVFDYETDDENKFVRCFWADCESRRHSMLSYAVSNLVNEGSLTDARSTFLLSEFQNLCIRVKDIDTGGEVGMSRNRNKSVEETRVICYPNPVRAKGCGKRLKSEKEKALSNPIDSAAHVAPVVTIEELVLRCKIAVDLWENVKAHAIIGLETSLEHEFLAILTEKAKIPIFSLSPSDTSSNEYPCVVKIRSDETSQFEGIASIVKSFEWKDVVLIYEEDTENERKTILHLAESLERKNIHISYDSVISLSSTDAQILKELQKLMTLETIIYIY
ncbi:Protein FAR1-RELATED SEQUENCE [Abeliophyllum distichum]|uniref:Protein FAR1-RELATED SEQUENCE n=1 Tax=Abeliophyllum distichum TaxID=126358 RepID=A0ABD1Q3L6_9LAMI